MGRPDELRGQIVVAYVVLRDGVARGEDGRSAAAARHVEAASSPRTSARARSSSCDALPRTATGKLQRFRLRDRRRTAADRSRVITWPSSTLPVP